MYHLQVLIFGLDDLDQFRMSEDRTNKHLYEAKRVCPPITFHCYLMSSGCQSRNIKCSFVTSLVSNDHLTML